MIKFLISSLTFVFFFVLIQGSLGQDQPPYYEQMQPDRLYSASFYPMEYIEAPVSRYQATDNFIVPPDESWELTEIEVYGDDHGIDILYFDLFLYYPILPDDFTPSTPGDVYHEQFQLSFEKTGEDPSLFKIFLNTPVIVPTGEYWLSVVAQPDWLPNGDPAGGFGWRRNASPMRSGDHVAYVTGNQPPFGWEREIADFTFRLNRPARIPLSNYGIFLGIGLMLILGVLSFRRFYR